MMAASISTVTSSWGASGMGLFPGVAPALSEEQQQLQAEYEALVS